MSVREGEWAALLVLERVTAQGAYLNLALSDILQEQHLDGPSRSMTTALVRVTLEHLISADFALSTVTDTRRCGRTVKNILRLGTARLLYMKAESAAVVNAAVEMCKKAGKAAQTSFVNGVLRKLSASISDIPWPSREKDPYLYLSIRYSWPIWAVKQAEKQLGFSGAEAFLSGESQPFVTMRVNRRLTTPDRITIAFLEQGAKVKESPYDPFLLRVEGLSDVTALKGYREGLFSLQGEASFLLANQIPQDARKVMDLCAAPGGKTCALAERLPDAEIHAFDIHPHRVELMRSQLERLQLSNVISGVQDATISMEQHFDSADAVLVDAPCSGLGTARKRPDVKQNREFQDILTLSQLQKKILNNASRYVKPGGTLIYGTCTFLRQENRDVVEDFLTEHVDFKLIPLDLPSVLTEEGRSDMMQLWPHIHGTDGFFMARMQRIG